MGNINSPRHMCRAWDGQYYTLADFVAWYGKHKGFNFCLYIYIPQSEHASVGILSDFDKKIKSSKSPISVARTIPRYLFLWASMKQFPISPMSLLASM